MRRRPSVFAFVCQRPLIRLSTPTSLLSCSQSAQKLSHQRPHARSLHKNCRISDQAKQAVRDAGGSGVSISFWNAGPQKELLLAAVACAASGTVRGVPVQRLREDDSIDALDLRGSGIDVTGATLLALMLPAATSLRSLKYATASFLERPLTHAYLSPSSTRLLAVCAGTASPTTTKTCQACSSS